MLLTQVKYEKNERNIINKHIMNICMIADSLSGGGTEKVLINTAEALQLHSHNVSIILLENIIEHEINQNIKIYYLKPKKNTIKTLINHIEKKQNAAFDYIYVHGKVKTTKTINIPNIYYLLHNPLSKRFSNNNFIKGLIRKKRLQRRYKDKKLIAVSDGVKNDALMHGFKPKSIQTIYNPFNFEKINKKATINDLDIPKQDYIINVGWFTPRKRHDILLKAFLKTNLNCKLILLGGGSKKEINKIKQLIEKLNLQNKVSIIPFKKNPYPLIKKAKLLVSSSDSEGLPTVLIESLVLNTITVSTNCVSGPAEIMVGDLSQYLSPIGNIDLLANNIKNAFFNPIKIDKKKLERFKDTIIIKKYLNPEKYLDI